MQIFVDADACPVVAIIEKIAKENSVPVTLLCDTNHVLSSDYSEVVVVGAGADAVDYKLISICHKGDIVVSQDYGVAAMALGKGASVHHGNTEKLVKRIAEECQVDLIDVVKQPDADLSSYDMIGFASGIYFSKFHQSILGFAEKNLPDDKKVFLICTYGGSANYKSIEQILDKKRSKVTGKFGCKGYDTFGPFKLVGGIAKGHPNEEDMKNAVEFVKGL